MRMTGYTKLFQEILSSSIWGEDDKTRIVWITMLAARGADNVVRASFSGLAHLARVSIEDTRKAVTILESPDEDSRSPEYEGRRIERTDGGWLILNGGKYREARSHDERREYMRKYMAEYRKGLPTPPDTVNKSVNKRKPKLAKVKSELSDVNAVSPDRDRAETEQRQEESSPDPRFAAVTAGYCMAYASAYGEDYAHKQGRDGKALSIFLKTVSPDISAEQIVTVIGKAMAHRQNPYSVACKRSSSIHGFCEAYNEIRAELKSAKPAKVAGPAFIP